MDNLFKDISYKIRNSKRAKRMSLLVNIDGSVTAIKPVWVKDRSIESFVNKHREWIRKSIDAFLKRKQKIEEMGVSKDLLIYGKRHYKKYKEEARRVITKRLEEINRDLNYEYKRVSIRNQKTMWGSCSSKGNLNFNYKLIFHKPEVMDYIIIHELCHLKELNHGRRFWTLVKEVCPEYKKYEKGLRGWLR